MLDIYLFFNSVPWVIVHEFVLLAEFFLFQKINELFEKFFEEQPRCQTVRIQISNYLDLD